jgi:hypothetical protein
LIQILSHSITSPQSGQGEDLQKIEAVKRVLSDAMGGQEIEYLDPRENHRLDRHLFRTGPREAEHRLWLGDEFIDDCALKDVAAELAARLILALFAATADKDILLKSTLARPQYVERATARPPATCGGRTG